MAQQLRIDKVTQLADGTISVEYTYGETPLDVNPSGQGVTWPSRQAMRDQIQAMKDSLSVEQLILLRLIQYARSTGDTQLTNRAAMAGKSITTDYSMAGTNTISMT